MWKMQFTSPRILNSLLWIWKINSLAAFTYQCDTTDREELKDLSLVE